MTLAHSRQEGAEPAADIHDRVMGPEIVRIQYVPGNQRLRLGHQRRIGGRIALAGGGFVGPEAGEFGIAAALTQQRERIADVAVECRVMAHHREDGRVAQKGCARFAEAVAAVGLHTDQPERCRRAQQALRAFERDIRSFCEGCVGDRRMAHPLKQAAFDDRSEDLRVDKAGDKVERGLRLLLRYGPRERVAHRPGLEIRV